MSEKDGQAPRMVRGGDRARHGGCSECGNYAQLFGPNEPPLPDDLLRCGSCWMVRAFNDGLLLNSTRRDLLSAQRLAAEARAGAIEECVDAIKSAGLSIGAAPGSSIHAALFYAIDKIRALASAPSDGRGEAGEG